MKVKIFETSVNAIMTVEKTFVRASNFDRISSGIIAEEIRVLKSYMPENNVLWSPQEREQRRKDFFMYNSGLVGQGDTILRLNDNGTLTEFYSGLEVIPVEANSMSTMGSSFGDATYYGAKNVEKEDALYVPINWLREVTNDNALSVINKMFADRGRNIEEEIVAPLKNRFNLVSGKNKSQDDDEVLTRHHK